jgi:hypothetical protein
MSISGAAFPTVDPSLPPVGTTTAPGKVMRLECRERRGPNVAQGAQREVSSPAGAAQYCRPEPSSVSGRTFWSDSNRPASGTPPVHAVEALDGDVGAGFLG